MSVYWSLFFIFISVLLQGFFSGSEFALVCSDKRTLRQRAEKGGRFSKRALRLIDKPEWFFSVTILCTNVCAIFTTTLSTFLILDQLGSDYEFLTILFIPMILLVSEILPKTIYQIYATQLAPYVGTILLFVSYLFYPFVYLLSVFGRFFLKRVGRGKNEVPSRQFLDTMIRENAERSIVEGEESSIIIQRIFDLTEKDVENMMVPLINVVAVKETATVEEALLLFEEEEFTRLPVYKDKIIHIVGYITVHELFNVSPYDSIAQHMKKIEYVPESMPSEDVFTRFKEHEIRIAAVVDEYGGAVGIITLEDILEEIVGEIEDEYDEEDALYRWISNTRLVVNASMEIEALQEQLKLDIPSGGYETLAGYLLSEFEKIPRVGESIQRNSMTFVIRRATPRMIEEVEIIGAFEKKL